LTDFPFFYSVKNDLAGLCGIAVIKASMRSSTPDSNGNKRSLIICGSLIRNFLRIETLIPRRHIINSRIIKCVTDTARLIRASSVRAMSTKDIYNISLTELGTHRHLGSLVSTVVLKTGIHSGSVSILASNTSSDSVSLHKGIYFKIGYLSPFFATPSPSLCCTYSNCRVLLSEGSITNFSSLLHLVEFLSSRGRALSIFCSFMSPSVVSTLVLNHLKGSIKVVVSKFGAVGSRRREMCLDLSAVTGAVLIKTSYIMRSPLRDASLLGYASRLTVRKTTTHILGEPSFADAVSARISELRVSLSLQTSDRSSGLIKESLSRLSSANAVINISSSHARDYSIKSAILYKSIHSLKTYISEGYLPGGGSFFLLSSKKIKLIVEEKNKIIWSQSLASVCNALYSKSHMDPNYVFEHIANNNSPFYGFDIISSGFGDMRSRGIFDCSQTSRKLLCLSVLGSRSFITASSVLLRD